MKKEDTARKVALILSLIIVVIVLGFLSYRYLAPFGKIVSYRFPFKIPGVEEITTFSPQKDSILKIPSQIIKTSISKFSLKLLSKDIASIEATLKFKKGPKEIKLGVRGNEKDSFFYQPLYHSLIQDLNWEKIEKERVILFQKKRQYSSLSDFAANPPKDKKAATYFYDSANLLAFQAKGKPKENLIINAKLRGSHVFYVRVDYQPFKFAIEKFDQNAYEGEDEYKVTVFYNQNIISEKTIPDDGITDSSRLMAGPQRGEIEIPDAKPGIYKIDVSFLGQSSDAIISKIETNQEKLVAADNLFIINTEPTSIWTNAKTLTIGTPHPGFEQTLMLDDEYPLGIEKFNVRYNFDLDHPEGKENIKSVHKLKIPKNDLGISGENVFFAFSQESFFLPEILKSVDLSKLTELKDIDYILTTCPQAKKEGDWLVAETVFDPQKIRVEGDKLYFSLEAPELAKYGGELEIDYLEVAVKHNGFLGPKISPQKETPPAPQKKNIIKEVLDKLKSLKLPSFDLFKQKPKSLVKPTGTPSPTRASTATPTAVISPQSTIATASANQVKVFILNGGAEKGAASTSANALKDAGFTNVLVANADNFAYKNATIRYRKENKNEADKISELLKKEYQTIEKKEISTTSAEIAVILGQK